MYCDLGSLMQILMYGQRKIKVNKTKAINRSGIIERLTYLYSYQPRPRAIFKKICKKHFSVSSYSKKMRWGRSCQFMKQKTENSMKMPVTEMELLRLAILSFKV